MNVNTLVNYKHSLFIIKPQDTAGVKIVKSKCFGYTWYAVRDNQLLCVLDSTVANDSYILWKALAGEHTPSANDLGMYAEEKL